MMRIGEFSKATNLSVKALRHYHDKGLLQPDHVDSWTGYRYYAERALERARVIVRLRGFGLSLQEIQDTLTPGQGARSQDLLIALKTRRAALHGQIRKFNDTMLAIEDSISTSEGETTMNQSRFQMNHDVNGRVEAWLAQQDERRDDERASVQCFTIDCAYGAIGGSTSLASVLAERVGFSAWDEVLLDAIASDATLREKILGALSEAEREEASMLVQNAVVEGASASWLKRLEIAAALAICGRCVLINTGANNLLTKTHALRILLAPNHETVAPHLAVKHDVESAEAERQVNARREEMARHVRETFGREIDEVSGYDLVTNSSTLDLFSVVELAVQAYESRFSPEAGWWYPCASTAEVHPERQP